MPKIKISQRNINKVLNYIAQYEYAVNGNVFINDKFYEGLKPMNKSTINQILNALEAEEVVIKYPPNYQNRFPSLKLTEKAFAYNLHNKKDNRRFIITTVISIIALIKSFDVELASLWKLLEQLWTKP